MIIYIIGPSGVGKSSICKEIIFKNIKCFDLDYEMKKKDENIFLGLPESDEFCRLAKSCISNISNNDSESVWLIDVGAGCMANQELLGFLKSKENLMAITDRPINAYNKAIMIENGYWKNQSFVEYSNSEFSVEKKTLYDSANFKFDVEGDDLGKTVKRFIKYVKEAINLQQIT